MRNVVLLTTILALAAVGSASILTDTYELVNPSTDYTDNGLNAELDVRQSGTAAPVQYLKGNLPDLWASQVDNSGHPGKLWLLPQYVPATNSNVAWLALNHNFASDVRLQVAMDPVVGETASGSWATVTLRGADASPDNASCYNVLSTDVGAGLLMASNGGWQYFENGGMVISGTVSATAIYNLDILVVGDQLSASINGSALDLNGAAAGTIRTMAGDGATRTNNYITLGGAHDGTEGGVTGHEFDDLVVSVPEPTTMALLGMGGVAILARRRKK